MAKLAPTPHPGHPLVPLFPPEAEKRGHAYRQRQHVPHLLWRPNYSCMMAPLSEPARAPQSAAVCLALVWAELAEGRGDRGGDGQVVGM